MLFRSEIILIRSVAVDVERASKASIRFIELESLVCENEKKNELIPKILVIEREVITNRFTNLCLDEKLSIVGCLVVEILLLRISLIQLFSLSF